MTLYIYLGLHTIIVGVKMDYDYQLKFELY